MRHLLAAVVVTLVIAAVAGCSDDGVGAGEAAVEISEGSRILVAEKGDDLTLAEGRRTLHDGADVKALAGSATITFADGARLEVRDGSEIRIGRRVELVSSDLLVASGRTPVEVEAAGSTFTVDGVAQLSRDLAVTASSYRGSVAVRSAARGLRIAALREANVASLGILPTSARPLQYDATDAWDRRYLAEAIELGEQLEAKSRGFTDSVRPGEGRTPGFYRLLLPELEKEPQFDESLITPDLTPGKGLVGATIVLRGRVGSFADRWAAVFGFYNEGAHWGLVALDQQVSDTSGLVASVDAAIGRQSFAFAPAASVAPAPAAPEPVAAPGPTPAPGPAPAERPRTPEPAPATTPPTTRPPDPELITVPTVPPLLAPPDPNNPPPGLLEPLLTSVTSTLDGLLGGNRNR